MAIGEFRSAHHTQGLEPKEALFNPKEKPDLNRLAGLSVRSDKDVPPGHIRICADAALEAL
jgi:hypothetical protein